MEILDEVKKAYVDLKPLLVVKRQIDERISKARKEVWKIESRPRKNILLVVKHFT